MKLHRFQLVLTWLVAASLLFQSVWAGVPAGIALCIGCDEGGWSISQVEAPDAPKSCCASESVPPEIDRVAAFEGDGCDCVRIPVNGAEGTMLLATRAASPAGHVPALASVATLAPLTSIVDVGPRARPPRAGPESPPRLLTPSSRCTVLLL